MLRTVARIAVMVLAVLLFVLACVSIALRWPAAQWIAPIGYGLFGVAVVLGAVRRPTRKPKRGRSTSELSATDEYSDLQLGRRPMTHYPRDQASMSQIGDPPQPPRPPAGA